MSVLAFSGYVSNALALNYTVAVPVTPTQIGNAYVNYVTVDAYMSTNAYTNTYGVRVRLKDAYGAILGESTRSDIKFNSGNYTGAVWNFTFSSNINTNAIASVEFFGLNDASKIFVKFTQTVNVEYYARSAPTVSTPTVNSQYVSGGNVTVSWTGTNVAYNDISSYIVYRSTNGGAWTEAGTLTAGAGARSLALAAGAAGSYCTFSVIAVAPYGNSTQTAASPAVYTYTNPSVSGVQLNSSTSDQYVTSGNLTLSWTGTVGSFNTISSYTVERSLSGAAYASWTGSTGLASPSLSVAAPSAGQYYAYRIKAIGQRSNSTATVSTAKLYTYSAPTITGIKINASGSTQYLTSGAATTLAWTGTNGGFNEITSYTIQRKLNTGAWVNLVTGLTTNSYAINASTTPNDYYTYQIIAYAPRVNGTYTASPLLYTYSLPEVSAIQIAGSTTTQYAATGATPIALSWTGTPGAQNTITGYKIEVSNNGAAFTVAVASHATTTYNITAQDAAGAYFEYRITPLASKGNGSTVTSPKLYTYAPVTVPTTVSIAPNNAHPGDSITLSWSGALNGVGVTIAKYEIYVGTSTYVGESASASFTFNAPGAGSYAYKIKTIASNTTYNSSGYSSTAALTVTLSSSPFTLSIVNPNTLQMDGNAQITAQITPIALNLTHVVKWYINGNTLPAIGHPISNTTAVNLNLNTINSVATIPESWSTLIPNNTTVQIFCEVTTKEGSTVLGSSIQSFIGAVPTSVIPTVTLGAAQVSGISLFNTYYLKGRSKATVTPVFTGAQGSTLSTWSLSASWTGGSTTGNSSPWTPTNPFPVAGTVTLSAIATDSRGRSSIIKSTPIIILDYVEPKLTEANAPRTLSNGTIDNIGTYFKGKIKAVAFPVGTPNVNSIATLNLKYRQNGTTGAWLSETALTSEVYTAVIGSGGIDINLAYEVLFTAIDTVGGTSTYPFIISAAKFLFDFYETRAGIGRLALPDLPENEGTLVLPDHWTTNIRAERADTLTTARTITIGNTARNFNGSAAITWSLTDIGAAATSHGTHVPTPQTANNAVYLRNDNTWQTITPAKIGAAATSHGNHVPTVGTANNAIFLRNDNTWQTVTPANIGAAVESHAHVKADITDFPTSMPASDVSAWAKAATKPSYTYSEIGAAPVSHAHGSISYSGVGDTVLSAYQTESSYYNSAAGWASYLILNHGDGATDCHNMLRFPFYDGPLKRQSMNGGTLGGWKTILDSGNYSDYAQKRITSGTAAPSGGVDGDIYIKYS